jgi:hypothetical protein
MLLQYLINFRFLILGRYCGYKAVGWFCANLLNCLNDLEHLKVNDKIKRAVAHFNVTLRSGPQLLTYLSDEGFF